MATKTSKPKKSAVPKQQIVIWDIVLSDGDWYWFFARSRAEAIQLVHSTHYHSLLIGEFKAKYKPQVERIPDHRKLMVNHEELGQKTRTARSWAKGESPGPFVSNTYES